MVCGVGDGMWVCQNLLAFSSISIATFGACWRTSTALGEPCSSRHGWPAWCRARLELLQSSWIIMAHGVQIQRISHHQRLNNAQHRSMFPALSSILRSLVFFVVTSMFLLVIILSAEINLKSLLSSSRPGLNTPSPDVFFLSLAAQGKRAGLLALSWGCMIIRIGEKHNFGLFNKVRTYITIYFGQPKVQDT